MVIPDHVNVLFVSTRGILRHIPEVELEFGTTYADVDRYIAVDGGSTALLRGDEGWIAVTPGNLLDKGMFFALCVESLVEFNNPFAQKVGGI